MPRKIKFMNEGRYLYGIIKTGKPCEFGSIGVGGKEDRVYAICYKGLAAVVSETSLDQEYSLARDNLISHQKVLEKVMEEFSVLPLQFGTVAKEEEIFEDFLKPQYDELGMLLEKIKDRVELGVKVSWTDIKRIFAEILREERSIAQLKEKVARESSPARRRAGMIEVGEMVGEALEEKREREKDELLAVLKPLSVDFKVNGIYGDESIANLAFLVEKKKEEEFDGKVEELAKEHEARWKIRYIGPVPPCNFVEITATKRS